MHFLKRKTVLSVKDHLVIVMMAVMSGPNTQWR